MNKSRTLFDAGKLNEAIEALGAELREQPSDNQRRTFLFEMLCFAGSWDRADKQLDLLAGDNNDRRLGALMYRGALNAERTRHEKIEKTALGDRAEPAQGAPVKGTLNGRPFESIEDADPRIGSRLEIFAGENYMWIPWEHVALLEMEPPKRLRDLLWTPATLRTFQSDLGQVLIPALSPFSWRHTDDQVRLGRATVWDETASGGPVPFGQKVLLADGEEFPLLELRKLEIEQLATE